MFQTLSIMITFKSQTHATVSSKVNRSKTQQVDNLYDCFENLCVFILDKQQHISVNQPYC